jgi:hypothetical protein
MDSAWIDKIAMTDASFERTELASALAYARGVGWLVDRPKRGGIGRISLTPAGEVVARSK